ncbi:TetR/AcrR family transcriptional regulator [Streptomyces sp. NPDC093595]|uniref:TetR/AcrR family transcriptional regulator n=1 Tax=Streptomyces sp. NPDC093595 TaxID=3366045 RepID=UPI00380C4553
MEATPQRPLRADAERSVRLILEAAERVLEADPAAPMEKIAEAAGVARTTVHRRFANRQALVEALAGNAARHLDDVVSEGRPETAPPLVALHQITAGVLRVKLGWRFALGHAVTPGGEAERILAGVQDRCLALLTRAQQAGLFDAGADLLWVRRVYYALIGETLRDAGSANDPDALAARIMDTLFHGFGPRQGAS